MGRKSKEEDIYVYMWLIHIVVWQKSIQYCKATILQLKIKIFKLTCTVERWDLLIQCDEFCTWITWYEDSAVIQFPHWKLPFNNSVRWARDTQHTHPMRPEPISTWILKAQIIALPTQPEEAQRSHSSGIRMHDPSVKMPANPVTQGEGALLVFNWKKKKKTSLWKKAWGSLSAMRGQNGHLLV